MKQTQQPLFPELPSRKPAPALRRRVPRPAPRRRGLPLWLAVQFPQLPLEALFHDQSLSSPAAAITPATGVVRVHSVNAAARDAGVHPGMTLAAAWSMLPELDVHERDPRRERATLLRLAQWSNRFTPAVCIDEQALLLEVRGSLQLFNGAENLRERVREGVARLGFDAHLAMAPTPRAALWLARAEHDACIDRLEELPAALGGLPLRILGLEERLLERIRGIGVRRLADVMRLPRDGLARRYGARVLRELDQALGRVTDVRCPVPPALRFRERLDLLHEVSEVARLLHPIEQLLQELDAWLRSTQQGVQRLQLKFTHRDRSTTNLVIGFACTTRDKERIRELLEQRLESFELPAPVMTVALHCLDVFPLAGSSRAFFPEQDESGEWAQLVERLQMRLGNAAVSSVEQCADHRPERAWRHVSPGEARESPGMAHRPHWLLENPQAITVRQGRPVMDGPLRIIAGPERIETGWWDEADVSRDYFIAHDSHGRRLWVCREAKCGRWWLQGIFE